LKSYDQLQSADLLIDEIAKVEKILASLQQQQKDLRTSAADAIEKADEIYRAKVYNPQSVSPYGLETKDIDAKFEYVSLSDEDRHEQMQIRAAKSLTPASYDPSKEKETRQKLLSDVLKYMQKNGGVKVQSEAIATKFNIRDGLAFHLREICRPKLSKPKPELTPKPTNMLEALTDATAK